MTYCVAVRVDQGLVMLSDTRTNAGVDSISTYRKLHVVDRPGERVLGVCTAGNLSVTQTAMAMAHEGVHLNVGEPAETLETAPTLFRAAQILGHALAMVRELVMGHEAVARTARSLFTLVNEANDQPTADLLTQRLQIHEKTAWMLRSLLEA